jgi:hypothetical protein
MGQCQLMLENNEEIVIFHRKNSENSILKNEFYKG